jgi:hypothetical protein
MKRLSLMCASVGLIGTTLAVAGCHKMDDDAFRGGVPTRETVALNVPGAPASGGALTAAGGVQSALLGQKADTYMVTRVVTAIVNGGTYAVLTLVKTIVGYPASSVVGDTAVWGPHTDPLSPNTWRLTVTRLEPHKFQWLLEARDKTLTDADFLNIISGTHTAAVDAGDQPIEGFGSGGFVIDWDAAAKLPEHDKNIGKATFTYSRLTADAVAHVDVDFKGVQDDKTLEIHDAVYKYTETPGQGGELQYASDQDNLPDPGNTGTAKEHFTIHSRWQQDGTGRCDLQDASGDLMTLVGQPAAHGSECWDLTFKSVYRYLEFPDAMGNWGAETDCTAFPTASYANL